MGGELCRVVTLVHRRAVKCVDWQCRHTVRTQAVFLRNNSHLDRRYKR